VDDGARFDVAVEDALVQRLRQRAGVGAQLFGKNRPAAFVGEQGAGAVARFGLKAHERLIGVLTHLVARQHPPARGDGVGVMAGLGVDVRDHEQRVEEALAQPLAFGL
jgi:hypothetical protein